jgi:hypothetical protein
MSSAPSIVSTGIANGTSVSATTSTRSASLCRFTPRVNESLNSVR